MCFNFIIRNSEVSVPDISLEKIKRLDEISDVNYVVFKLLTANIKTGDFERILDNTNPKLSDTFLFSDKFLNDMELIKDKDFKNYVLNLLKSQKFDETNFNSSWNLYADTLKTMLEDVEFTHKNLDLNYYSYYIINRSSSDRKIKDIQNTMVKFLDLPYINCNEYVLDDMSNVKFTLNQIYVYMNDYNYILKIVEKYYATHKMKWSNYFSANKELKRVYKFIRSLTSYYKISMLDVPQFFSNFNDSKYMEEFLKIATIHSKEEFKALSKEKQEDLIQKKLDSLMTFSETLEEQNLEVITKYLGL